MKKIANIAVDIETLSKRSTAAIIGIAAMPFSLGYDQVANEGAYFHMAIDATSCAMHGLHFDQSTVEWWSKQPEDAKRQFDYTHDIVHALEALAFYIRETKKDNGADVVRIWCQGTDFDISILRNVFALVFNDPKEEKLPWNYYDVRDSRTFINEGLRLLYPSDDNPIDRVPKAEGLRKHDVVSDCKWLIHNVK